MSTDYIIYPTIPEDLPLVGLQDSIDFTLGANALRLDMGYNEIAVAGIVPNLVKKVTLQHQKFLEVMRGLWGDYVWPEISNLTAWSEASKQRMPVHVYEPDGLAAAQSIEIANRLEGFLAHVKA